ncbi:MAG: response regulator [Chloroflexi bacterium]|nr:response regulator [Chloroflexota bacterium]
MERKKILVVDDEASIRMLVSSMLSDKYTVLTASDGEEAVSMARTRAPDLILMDIMMPKADGYTACSMLKGQEETKAIPVIMITGVGYEMNRRLAEKVGANGYLTKPFNIKDLTAAIEQFTKPI